MIALIWNIGTTIRGWLGQYIPSNIILDRLHARRGINFGLAAMALVIGFLYVAGFITELFADSASGWLNILVLSFISNAIKFAALLLVNLTCLFGVAAAQAHGGSGRPRQTCGTFARERTAP